MILEVGAYTGEVLDNGDVVGLQQWFGADAGELEELGGV